MGEVDGPGEHSSRGQLGAGSAHIRRRRAVREALAVLGDVGSAVALREAAPRALCMACDFSRAMLSAVQGSRWVPLVLHSRDELDPRAEAFRSYVEGGAEIPLANLLAETTMVRRRAGMLVPAAQIPTRAFAPIIEVARSTTYVAAPLVVDGRAIGFVHADRVGQRDAVDEDDLRLVEAFAGELAVLYRTVWWSDRLAERRARAEQEIDRAARGLALVAAEGVELRVSEEAGAAGRHSKHDGSRPRRAGEQRFLTAREWDVLAQVAEGATNGVVAHRLSLSEDTVKTHLRHVLRKVGVTSRAGAVAWYLEVGRGVR